MDTNGFIAKFKADGSEKDVPNLDLVLEEYYSILVKLPTAERGTFSVNVLCTLCRNIEKVPQWCDHVDQKSLVLLSIECMRQSRCLNDETEKIKLLACGLHINRYVVKQPLSVPPELVLKLSYMSFEPDTENLLINYAKTYWGILLERLTYFDKLKASKRAIIKLLPKLTEDITKVIHVYDTVQFSKTILLYLIKKLRFLYSDYVEELNELFGKIFAALSKKDLKCFRNVKGEEALVYFNVYVEISFMILENGSKIDFVDSHFDAIVRFAISILGHNPDIFHCLQTFYLNSFCCLLRNNYDSNFSETILNNLINSCETTEKLGYLKAMKGTYPYLSQFLKLYIEYAIANYERCKKDFFTAQIQESCLKLILFFMDKLKTTVQMLKCENCNIKTGLHDSLRLSFLIKNIINVSLKEKNLTPTILPLFLSITSKQYEVLTELNRCKCVNYGKCFRKLQTDVHNIAISLNKSGHNESSIKLFDLYLHNELKHFKDDNEIKNMSRALFNKSICELDSKLYEDALKDVCLSLVLSLPEGLKSDKHMSLVMDIKSKALKKTTDNDESVNEENQDAFQLLTILDCCKQLTEDCSYGNVGPLLQHQKFSILLRHEYDQYIKLWPSIVPIAGVWKSLLALYKGEHTKWLTSVEQKDTLLWPLLEIILSTPLHVRTIHNEYCKEIVQDLAKNFHRINVKSTNELKIVNAAILFLKTDYDLIEATTKYGWKNTDQVGPDRTQGNRTISQEYSIIKVAVKAVDILTEAIKHIDNVAPKQWLKDSLQICNVFVQQLFHLFELGPALQLAYICMKISERVGDRETYVNSATVILYHLTSSDSIDISDILNEDMLKNVSTGSYLSLLCASAIYYIRIGSVVSAAQLLQTVQGYILDENTKTYGNLDYAIGLLLEAQCLLCPDSNNIFSLVMNAQRHYLSITNTATNYNSRRVHSLRIKYHVTCTSLRAVRVLARAGATRRARGAACEVALGAVAGGAACAMLVGAHNMQTAQVQIDNRLKHILGLQPTNEAQQAERADSSQKLHAHFTPKQELESMRESVMFKKTQTSPSVPCTTVPAFKTPDFLTHDSSCKCHGCQNPSCLILTCRMTGLEASVYFRAKETDIAANYFDGAVRCFGLVDVKLGYFFDSLKKRGYEVFVRDTVRDDFCDAQLSVLIEAAFFELSKSNYEKADDYCVRIHEIMEEMTKVDVYLKSDVLNLMVASAQMRKTVKKEMEDKFIIDMEQLKLSPKKADEPPKTPEEKPIEPPKDINKQIIFKDEEVPKTKRKIIKLNLDENSEEPAPVKNTRSKRTVFKIPVPVTKKPVLEDMTPKNNRSIPAVIVTQPSIDEGLDVGPEIGPIETPKPKQTNQEFFTPLDTESEQFFTPMTSKKTYSKKGLKKTIVKNLESEFSNESTSHIEKENESENESVKEIPVSKKKVETGCLKTLREKRTLRRATSPGKLESEKKREIPRNRRLRQPTNFGVDKNK